MKSDKKYKISILLNQISHYKPFFYLAINNLKFFIKNIEDIKSWIETEIFKNKFMDINHPYPPLLDPKFIDYHKTPLEILWNINAPLPQNYAFLWLYSHGCGMLSLRDYFLAKTNLKIIDTYLFIANGGGEAKQRYLKILEILLSNPSQMYAIALSDTVYKNKEDRDKFFHLFSKDKLAILCQVRDPIELIRHILARKGRWDKTQLNLTKKQNFTLNDRFEDVFIDENHSYFNKNIRIINFPFLFVYADFMKVFDKHKIFYLDLKDIQASNIDLKLKSMSKDLNFKIISDDKNSECIRANYFNAHCMLWLPLFLKINDITINFDFHHRKNYSEYLELYEFLMKKRNEFFGIYIHKNDFLRISSNQNAFRKLSKYLLDFISKLNDRILLENTKLLNINEVIQHLREHPQDRIYLKSILDKDTQHIKNTRMDIVKSWKYYAIFENMFKNF